MPLRRDTPVPVPLPSNYRPENDPYADAWARFQPGEREELTQWHQVYYAMVANLDWNLGRLLGTLNRLCLEENTLLIFTSDHGEMFGAQGRRAKNIFYEEAIQVPFLMRWPGHIAPNQQIDVCLNTPDIMPTLLSLLGLVIPEEVEGMDLSRCALGQDGDEPEAAFMQGMGTTAAWQDGHEWRALRDKRYTYAIYRRDGAELLFDRQEDPCQTRNCISHSQYTAIHARLRKQLQARMQSLNDTFEACTWYRDHWTEDRVILRTAALEENV